VKRAYRKKLRDREKGLTMERLLARCRATAEEAMATDEYWEQQPISMLEEDLDAILRVKVGLIYTHLGPYLGPYLYPGPYLNPYLTIPPLYASRWAYE